MDIQSWIESKRDTFIKLSDAVWGFAEINYQEKQSAQTLVEALEKMGFTVERGLADIPTAFVGSFSRIMLLMYWIARPTQMNLTFNTFIFPCLGFLFLPFTTLMYVLLFWSNTPTGIQGLDWLWLILAVLLDVATIGGAGYANRNRIPAGYPGGVTPPPPASPPADSTPGTQ